jgi:hypothetical protein
MLADAADPNNSKNYPFFGDAVKTRSWGWRSLSDIARYLAIDGTVRRVDGPAE